MCWRPRESPCEDSVAHLVRSLRTCARIRSLTTGTFNLIVKDRITIRLSGAHSVQPDTQLVRVRPSSKPYKHTLREKTLSIRASHRISTGFPHWEERSGSSSIHRIYVRSIEPTWKSGPSGPRQHSKRPRALAPVEPESSNAQRYGLPPLRRRLISAHRPFFGRARAEDRKLRKELAFGGPCLEGTLQKPRSLWNQLPNLVPWAGTIEGPKLWQPALYPTLDAGRARELQKSAQPATQMLSIHSLYQRTAKKRKQEIWKRYESLLRWFTL